MKVEMLTPEIAGSLLIQPIHTKTLSNSIEFDLFCNENNDKNENFYFLRNSIALDNL